MKYLFLIVLLTSFFIINCVSIPKQYQVISPGVWRATLILKDTRQVFVTRSINKVVTRDVNPESTQTIIPFNFEVIYNTDSTFFIEVINGSERIKFDSILMGHDYRNGNDTMVIFLIPYAAQIKCIFENTKLAGEFIVNDKINYSIPFRAEYGKSYRFNKLPSQNNIDITGKWKTIFGKDSSDKFEAIGEFTQNDNIVTGTFRTETGDFRFLQGDIDNNIIKLSCFDGAHAFLFEGEVLENEIHGQFYSGKHYQRSWDSYRDNAAQLISADSLTKIIKNIPLQFQLPNSENNLISLDDEQYKGKPKVIQITGSWCPNCRDESEFILKYLKENPSTKTKFIAISFERKIDNDQGTDRIKDYKNSLKIPYEILLGGKANKDSASILFPQLDGIKAFPTLLFVDKNNKIIKTHTGFDGPATSQYSEFIEEFKETISKLESE
ncbi:MAG: TlpA family protein disulfide reductase [Saprospiraceae bacterium]|nr:TlpA family protein disulfide reductase [Saprospiraceae bacterium]